MLKHTCKNKAKEHEKNLSTYYNYIKEKTSSTPYNKGEKAVNVLNSLLNIYYCGKNIYQLTYECAYTALEKIFE